MKRILFTIVAMAMVLQSCSNGEENVRLNVRLTDAPGDYEEVIVDIVDVQINEGLDDSDENWVSLNGVKTGMYNLLDFTNGLDTLLVSDMLPPGHISQIRLVLGESNILKVNGEYQHLKTPSAQQSGLKLKTNITLIEGVEYNLWLDFNADKSVVENKNYFILKPVIRTFSEATSGAIKGIIEPYSSRCFVSVISEDLQDTISTYSDTLSGQFLFKGVADGKYQVQIEELSNAQKLTIDNVIVEIGASTNLGTINLN